MRVIAADPLAAVSSTMPVKIAKGIIATYAAPFGCPGPPSSSVQSPPTEVPYQTVVSPSRPLLLHGTPPSEPSPLEDHFSPLHLLAMVSPIRVDRLELELRGHPDQAKVAYVIVFWSLQRFPSGVPLFIYLAQICHK